MNDSPEANFQFTLLFLMIGKLTNKFAKENLLKYTWKIQSSNIYLCFLATQQFYETRMGVLIQIHASTYMLKSLDCQEGKQVRHADGFQWKMFPSIYPEQKIIGRCNLLASLQDTCLQVKQKEYVCRCFVIT